MRETGPFSAWIQTPAEHTRELWCAFRPDRSLQREADRSMAPFVSEVKASMDACVLEAAAAVCRPLGNIDPTIHRMPILSDEAAFDALPREGQLRGLRPDQIRALRVIQPFDSHSSEPIARTMQHLAASLAAIAEERRLFTAWEACPVPEVPRDVQIVSTEIDPAGPLHIPKRLATFKLDRRSAGAPFAGNPNVSFDVIMNAPPWPTDPDDNFSARSHWLLVIARHLIEGLERSVREPYRVEMLQAFDRAIPAEPVRTWHPVRFDDDEQKQEVRTAIEASERKMATYLNADGTLIYMRFSVNGEVVGREIAPAAKLLGETPDGAAIEAATRAAAGRWGLPDLVLQPKVFHKGNGVRELGDGTILAGRRGISLQVKSRAVTSDPPEKAERWMLKNAAQGLRQARGTIRAALLNPTVELKNLRGRTVTVRGTSIDWVPVVVIDHPNPPPTGVVPDPDPKGPGVVMMRRDWEFLWNQLRSATAIVDYVHRVATEDPLELGAETDRYFDLADKDRNSPPGPLPDWIPQTEARYTNVPLLPRDPAASSDEFGHALFQQILEDIANTDFTGDEADRIMLLSMIDRVAIGARPELGRLLLRRLTKCAGTPVGELRTEHRTMIIDHGALHVVFTTMSQLTDYYQEYYRTWLLHRRQTFLTASRAQAPIYPWTVGVLLSPRADGRRSWDTTVIATNGPPHFDQDEYDRLTPVLASNV